jgi:hypothetical protein
MIERESAVRVYNESLGVKGAKGKLVRVAEEGFYEITLEAGGRNYTTLLPVANTVVMAADALEEIPTLDVER